MTENFDLIFGQNASQQYAWSDNDYQKGWETIGSIPPTAAQFDALQRRADTKAKELNSRLIIVEQSIAGGGSQKREPDTEYTVGTILTYDDLPIDWVLECIVGGISSTNDITIPSPRVEGARILDGTVTWALRKIATYGGIGYRQSSTPYHTGSIAFSTSLPAGLYLDCTAAGTTGSGDLVVTRKNVGEIVTDGTVIWIVRKFADTTDATTTTNGLMSASDKAKLDGIANNANNYSLPAATGSTRGGVTVGSNISLSGDKISINSSNITNALGYTPPTTNTTYSTGTASYSGTTKLYTGVGDNTDGTMTQKAIKAIVGTGGGIVAASLTTNGYVKFADGYTIQWGTVAGSSSGIPFTFPIAFSSEVYGIQGISKSSTFSSVPASFDKSKTSLTGSSAGFKGGSGTISWFAYGC